MKSAFCQKSVFKFRFAKFIKAICGRESKYVGHTAESLKKYNISAIHQMVPRIPNLHKFLNQSIHFMFNLQKFVKKSRVVQGSKILRYQISIFGRNLLRYQQALFKYNKCAGSNKLVQGGKNYEKE